MAKAGEYIGRERTCGRSRRVLWSAALAMVASLAAAQAPLPGGPPAGADPNAVTAALGPPPPPPLPANAPPPATDPRNLNGAWYHTDALVFQITTDMFGNPTPYNDAGKKVMARRVKSLKDGTPFLNASARCLPVGQPWQMDLNMPFLILQSQDRIEFAFEEYHGLVTVQMDPAKALPPSYMGRSVGHWDGDTLVIETSGFKQPVWVDVTGSPASRNAKLTQRVRKVKTDHWILEDIFTLEDPAYYTRPWSWARQYDWRPDMTLFREYDCEVQTGAKDGMDPSLVSEPREPDEPNE